MSYAQNTTVSVDRSRHQIERELRKYGCSGFGYASEDDRAMIAFCIPPSDGETGLHVRMILPLPPMSEFRYTPAGRLKRTREAMARAWEQACASRWRALHLVIKAKLEAVETGISTIEREFLADTLTGSGKTIGELVESQRSELASGGMKLLGMGGAS